MQGLLKSLFCCNKKTKPHSYYRYVFGVCRANLAWIVKVARVKLISLTSADFNWCMVGVASARPAAISASHFFRPIRNNAETQTTVGGPFKPCFNGTWFTYKTHAWFHLFFQTNMCELQIQEEAGLLSGPVVALLRGQVSGRREPTRKGNQTCGI